MSQFTPAKFSIVGLEGDQLKKAAQDLRWVPSAGNGTTTACVNSLAGALYAIERGVELREWSDHIPCIGLMHRNLGIFINDKLFGLNQSHDATKWMHATAPKLLGTAGIPRKALIRALQDALFGGILPRLYGTEFSPRVEFQRGLSDDTDASFVARNIELCRKKGLDTQTMALLGNVLQYQKPPEAENVLLGSIIEILREASRESIARLSTVRCLADTLLNELCELKNDPEAPV